MASRGFTRILALGAAVSAALLYGVAPANADAPEVPEPAAFTAPACEGSTPGDSDLAVAGEQLANYNAGGIAVLYSSEGDRGEGNGRPPGCGVRYVADEGGPVSEWMYCTDKASWACLHAGEDGTLRDSSGAELDPMEWLTGNPRLSEDQAKLFSYILHTEIPVTARTYWPTTPAMTASNASFEARDVRQDLIWCVSDRDTIEAEAVLLGKSDHVEWCEANMSADRQAEILASIPETTVLSLSLTGDNANIPVGSTARFQVTTNVFNAPITLAVTGAPVTVCSGDATISGGTLTVAGTDASQTKTVELCSTSAEEGSTAVSLTHTPASTEHLSWSQATHATVVNHCQVYATLETTRLVPLTAQAVATFAPQIDVLPGTFSLQKALSGVTADEFAAGTEFEVTATWTIDGSTTSQEYALPADGSVIDAGVDLPSGTVITLSEGTAPNPAGYTFASVDFSPTAVTIQSDEDTLVTVTNTYEATPVVPPKNPDSSPSNPRPATVTNASPGLATTGAESLTGILVAGGVLLSLGAIVLMRRRATAAPAEK